MEMCVFCNSFYLVFILAVVCAWIENAIANGGIVTSTNEKRFMAKGIVFNRLPKA